MKDFFKIAGVIIGSLIVIGVLAFYFGFLGNAVDSTVGKQNMNIQRKNFEQSQSYVEGMIQTLAKEKQEYDLAKNDSDKQAILNYVNSTFASFDASNITDQGLYNFLMKARGN